MKERSKILLSKKETEVLGEEEFFRLKRSITEKIFQLLAETAVEIKSTRSFNKVIFPAGCDISRGKITKGENYLGLPFIILDFPRLFSGKRIFAVRTMVWWGNHVSCTLIVSGEETTNVKKKLLLRHSMLIKSNAFICTNESPWHHHFGEDNYSLLKSMSKTELKILLGKRPFIKLAFKIPIVEINRAKEFTLESFETFVKLL